ncbi:MAG: hypothetical protein FJ211_07155 [Ignavibacteria bacterium]|nr:hypothetical protein [Ignavibacteria bacterium]
MKLFKTILVAVIAILAAMVVWSVLTAVLSFAFKVTMLLVKIIFIVALALPVFFYLRRKLLSSK